MKSRVRVVMMREKHRESLLVAYDFERAKASVFCPSRSSSMSLRNTVIGERERNQ